MDPHLVEAGGVVGTVVAAVGSLAQVNRRDVALDLVLAPERQGAVVARVGTLPVVHGVHVPAHLQKIWVMITFLCRSKADFRVFYLTSFHSSKISGIEFLDCEIEFLDFEIEFFGL